MQSRSSTSYSEISLSLPSNERTRLLSTIPLAKTPSTSLKSNSEKKNDASMTSAAIRNILPPIQASKKTAPQQSAGSIPAQEASTTSSTLGKEDADLPIHLWLLKRRENELRFKGDTRFGAPPSAILDDENDQQVKEEYQKILNCSASNSSIHLWLLKRRENELCFKGDTRFGAPPSAILDDEDDPQVEEEYQKILNYSASKT